MIKKTLEKMRKKTKKSKKVKDKNAPKSYNSAYLFYCVTQRPEIREAHPDYGITEAAIELGKRWKALSEEDKTTVTDIVNEHEEWLNSNKEMTDKIMVEQKMKELQDSISPIMSKLYPNQDGGMDPGSMGGMDPGSMGGMDPGSMGGMDPGSMGSGPTIDEVD